MNMEEDLEASKDAEEICFERARFLLNIEEILEQILEDNDNVHNPIYQENNISIETNIPLVFV